MKDNIPTIRADFRDNTFLDDSFRNIIRGLQPWAVRRIIQHADNPFEVTRIIQTMDGRDPGDYESVVRLGQKSLHVIDEERLSISLTKTEPRSSMSSLKENSVAIRNIHIGRLW